MKGIKSTAREKEKALKMLAEGKTTYYVCKKAKCCRKTLWIWRNRYDGTLESLKNKSSVPHTPHPTAHTEAEIDIIKQALEDNPNMGNMELFGLLRTQYAYTRSFGGMNGVIRKKALRTSAAILEYSKYTPQEYNTPTMLGFKWQLDVKYVPTVCYIGAGGGVGGTRFYQYTVIDEASRERFIYPYSEHTADSTKDFVCRAINYFGYVPQIIQTDNGKEFINAKVERQLRKLKIQHGRIKPRTPRHNGKVERSHRNDNNRFYIDLKFASLFELRNKMATYLVRSNNIPTSALKNRHGKQSWQTPLQKRAELLEVLAEQGEALRLAKKPKRADIMALPTSAIIKQAA